MANSHSETVATDSQISRNRLGRIAVFTISVLVINMLTISVFRKIADDFFGQPLLGIFLGLWIGISIAYHTRGYFFIHVPPVTAFVTVDQIAAFFKWPDPYVTYGPGFHISYPWEARYAENNVSLGEASQDFSADIQGKDGTIHVKGSVRMRPDICRLPQFIGGVAGIAAEITDIIKAFVLEFMGNQGIDSAISNVKTWNEKLSIHFGVADTATKIGKVSNFEGRFGVSVGDVTIAEILPSAESQKTRIGLDEAKIINQGTAIILGFSSPEEMQKARETGTIKQDDINKARDRFMAATENLKMNVDANEYTIRIEGLDPDMVSALAQVAPIIAAQAAKGKKPQQKDKGNG